MFKLEPLDGFRAAPPKWETTRQKYKRVQEEIDRSARNVQRRLREIEADYRVPLTDLYKKAFFSVFKGSKELYEEMVRRKPKVHHCLEILDHGDIETLTAGEKMPEHFYRTTKVASWRQYRFYHHKGFHADHLHDPKVEKHRRHHVELDELYEQDPKRFSMTDTYTDYVKLLAREISRGKAKEMQKQRRLRLGTFALLTPYDVQQATEAVRRKVLAPDRGHKLEMRGFDVGTATKFLQRRAEQKLEAIKEAKRLQEEEKARRHAKKKHKQGKAAHAQDHEKEEEEEKEEKEEEN